MIDLNIFKNENGQISLKSLIDTRCILQNESAILFKEVIKFQSSTNKDFLKDPVYLKYSHKINENNSIVNDICKLLSLYCKFDNISHIDVIDDREEINNLITYPKASSLSFNSKEHKIAFKIIGNRCNKTSICKGNDEYVHDEFNSLEIYKNHIQLENRFYQLSKMAFECATHWSVNDFVKDNYRVIYGYIDQYSNFYETGKIE